MKKDRTCVGLFSWLEIKNLFQTFAPDDGLQLEQDINDIRTLLDEETENGDRM